jgi:hypothetical protein
MPLALTSATAVQLGIVLVGLATVVCLAMTAYRLRAWPSLDPLWAFAAACMFQWMSARQSNSLLYAVLLVACAACALFAVRWSQADLRKAKAGGLATGSIAT